MPARSLRDGLNPGEVVNRMLLKTRVDAVCILFEGSKDVNGFAHLFKSPPAESFAAKGKESVIELSEKISELGRRTVIGIVDADEICLTDDAPTHDCDIFYTDCRDLESMQFQSDAGLRLLAQIFDGARLREFEASRKATVREWITEQLSTTGAARVLNAREGLGISFKNVDVGAFVDPSRIELRIDPYLRELAQSSNRRLTSAKLADGVERIKETADPRMLLHGHDLTAFLERAAQGQLGAPGSHNAGSIEMALRAAYSKHEFRDTKLHESLTRWSERTGHAILAS